MDLTGYVEQLQADLRAAAAAGDETTVQAAERLASALDAAARMALLEALSDAAAEITSALDDVAVEVRLKGRDPQFAVTSAARSADRPDGDRSASGEDSAAEAEGDDGLTARITLRLPDALKARAEAAAARSRRSLNTWLVDVVRDATSVAPPARHGTGRQLSGWAR